TYLVPGLLLALGDMAVVVKASLLKIPYMGVILRATRPVALGRKDARKDLARVMDEGAALLRGGRGMILFPQGTRRHPFEERRFNTLGEKLSARAGVPLVPLAVDTRFQALGKIVPDLGAIRPRFTVRVECGEPIPAGLPARERHARSVAFIKGRLLEWGVPVVNETAREDARPPNLNTNETAREDARPPTFNTKDSL
ncbi:MAG: 1-acyl-sn-glycerol-3-phosphate acyltransferase, partial [Kiritimatiellaeota bacterium]|nr:1-acyl-sn-glycerol-3-phosphate acyltransferase [Kiritimatiellota bacterium]